jgi:tetratricopeptide (TPR) repeat protein
MGAAAVAILLLATGCASAPEKPKDPKAQREWLLDRAKEKFQHALRISKKYSNVPFNQAREQLIYVNVYRGRYEIAAEMAEKFLGQKREYLEDRRHVLLDIDIAWQKKKDGNPKLKGSSAEKSFLDTRTRVLAQINRAAGGVTKMLLLLGDIYLRQDQKPQALARYKEVLDVNADHAGALARVGQTHIKLLNWSLAAGYLDRAATRFEKVAMQIEEELETPTPENRTKAQSMGRRLSEVTRMREDVLATLGLCHFLAREFPSFEQAFKRILQDNPDSTYLPLKIGLALLKDGHRREGSQQIEKFIARPSLAVRQVRDLARVARDNFLKPQAGRD